MKIEIEPAKSKATFNSKNIVEGERGKVYTCVAYPTTVWAVVHRAVLEINSEIIAINYQEFVETYMRNSFMLSDRKVVVTFGPE